MKSKKSLSRKTKIKKSGNKRTLQVVKLKPKRNVGKRKKSLHGFRTKIFTSKKKRLEYISKKGNFVPLINPIRTATEQNRLLIVKKLVGNEKSGFILTGKRFDSRRYNSLDSLFAAIDWELIEAVFVEKESKK